MKNLLNQTNKFDKGKLRFSLFPLSVLSKIVEVLEFGAKKYYAESWKKVRPTKRYYDSALRHLFAWMEGEKLDNESGLNHLAHAICCIVFLLYFELKGGDK